MKNLIDNNSESYSLKISEAMFILILMINNLNAIAQPVLTIYSDVGKNIVSDGFLMRSAFLGNYSFGNYQLKTGIQTNLINNNSITLSGYSIDGSRSFKLGGTLFELNGFCLWTASCEIIQEFNYGGLLVMKSRHFDLQCGTNFRTYSFRNKAVRIYEIGNDETKIHENFNLMYSFGYNLKSIDHKWNAGLTLTNIDYFLINQETNPYVNLKGRFRISSPVCLFAEAWYKTTGATNLSSNYFGFLMRGGIVWNFK